MRFDPADESALESWRQPAEWAPHAACWVAWPSAENLWRESLPATQRSFVALVEVIADIDGARGPRGERLEVLVPDAAREQEAATALGRLLESGAARLHRLPFGDIWLRDTAPIFVENPEREVAATTFDFNGWGGQYVQPDDDGVAGRVAALSGLRRRHFGFVLEGGSVEVDGEGTCLTTRECLLNPNRNPGMDQGRIEEGLRRALGVERILWLPGGLANDPTDGHVDTLARFVAQGVVVCMEARTRDDPNAAALAEIARDLAVSHDARGRKLEVVRVPSPGRVVSGKGEVVPASYLNFYIGNRVVVVPTYGVAADDEALRVLEELFPGRRVTGLDARALVWNGGAFHCITQQEPGAAPRGAP